MIIKVTLVQHMVLAISLISHKMTQLSINKCKYYVKTFYWWMTKRHPSTTCSLCWRGNQYAVVLCESTQKTIFGIFIFKLEKVGKWISYELESYQINRHLFSGQMDDNSYSYLLLASLQIFIFFFHVPVFKDTYLPWISFG